MNFTDILPSLLIPKHIPIENKKRFGNNGDSGYVLYEPDVKKCNKLISLGCDNSTSFEEDILNYNKNITVDIYDIDSECDLANNNNRVNFYKERVVNIDEKVGTNDHAIIQMDIEGSEFYVFQNPLDLEKSKNISQLIIEIHFNMIPNNDINLAINLLQNINTIFDLVHIHGNNHVATTIGPVPMVIECTYLNKNLKLNLQQESNSFPIENLDYPNHKDWKDHQLLWWTN